MFSMKFTKYYWSNKPTRKQTDTQTISYSHTFQQLINNTLTYTPPATPIPRQPANTTSTFPLSNTSYRKQPPQYPRPLINPSPLQNQVYLIMFHS